MYGPLQQPNADDLQMALQASRIEADDKDDELTKAISMSLASLGSTEEETIGAVQAIKPEDRIRDGNRYEHSMTFLHCALPIPPSKRGHS